MTRAENPPALHLWDVKHPYYCQEGNYYKNDCHTEFKSWADFLAEWGDADMDYNLFFRWDWHLPGHDDCEPKRDHDPNYRSSRLRLHWVGQRKAYLGSCDVEVCENDEPQVRAWLEPRFRHLLSLWEPLLAARQGGGQ